MTEGDWLQSTNPAALLEFLQKKASRRKLRLFAAACCRRLWPLLDDAHRAAVELAERVADGVASQTERRLAEAALESRGDGWRVRYAESAAAQVLHASEPLAARRCADLAERSAHQHAYHEACDATDLHEAHRRGAAGARAERGLQADLLRDIFGPLPFRPVLTSISRAWNGAALPRLAQAIYEERAFDRLPFLADALEDAGCTDPEMLAHCRTDAVHARGCWVLDLLLERG